MEIGEWMFHAEMQASARRLKSDTTKRAGFHEAKRFSESYGYRRSGCRNAGSAGDRAIDAGNKVALGGELAEIARYALGRRRIVLKARCRSHRQQVPDS